MPAHQQALAVVVRQVHRTARLDVVLLRLEEVTVRALVEMLHQIVTVKDSPAFSTRNLAASVGKLPVQVSPGLDTEAKIG